MLHLRNREKTNGCDGAYDGHDDVGDGGDDGVEAIAYGWEYRALYMDEMVRLGWLS